MPTAPATPSCGRGSERRREQQRLDLVRDAVEPATAVRMRADRGQRVDLRPGGEPTRKPARKHDDRGRAPPAAARAATSPTAGDDREGRDHGRGVVDADRAKKQGRRERHRGDEHGGTARERRAGEDAERSEGDEPGDEHERRAGPGVVGPRQPHVEARQRCGGIASAREPIGGFLPAAIAIAVGRDVRE